MDTATTWAIVIGSLGFALGVLNFVYWAWWARRDRVAIVINEIWTYLVPKGEEPIGPEQKRVAVTDHCLNIYISCALVLTRGEKEIEAKRVVVSLHKPTCEKLKKYFRLPDWNRFALLTYAGAGDPDDREPGGVLQPKKSVDFTRDLLFKCTDEFKEKCENIGSGTWPDFIESLIEQLGSEYEMCWTRYDDRELCWRFPQRWYRNLGVCVGNSFREQGQV